MRSAVITISKFVGTISLGLLTGVSYSLATITLPSLLHLPTASLASATHRLIKNGASAFQAHFAGASSAFLALAYVLSPSRIRHPYLLWTAMVAAAGGMPLVTDRATRYLFSDVCERADEGVAVAARKRGGSGSGSEERGVLAESAVMVGATGSAGSATSEGGSSDEGVDVEGVNGEVVRRSVDKGRYSELVKAGIWGLGFAMGVVGLWGDGA